jgi:sugar phosphate isomerase/epimerase
MNRRQFHGMAAVAATRLFLETAGRQPSAFQPRYLLASSMYGCLPLDVILPEVQKTGATAIDLWPRVHGNQREQLDEMGEAAFATMLREHELHLGCLTQFPLGPFGLQAEMRLARRLGCRTIVTGSAGPRHLTGKELKAAVSEFVEKMKPHLAVAEENGVTIAIENHGNSLIDSPDSLKWLAELTSSDRLQVALAPYHLPQQEAVLARLIRDLGPAIGVFYAWQYGMGCLKKLPREQELLQMPGRGPLDFRPLVEALAAIRFEGWTEIFMHPVPRGIPVRETPEQVTAEINRARRYLESLIPHAKGR